jgi:hypothetical protein
VADGFSSMAFGHHLFCGGRYCGCVSLNIFSASFTWLSFALRHCNFRFWDRVNLDGHHRGMEYFGSAVLMAVVSSFLVVLANSSKIIGPSLFSYMITSVVPILMISFFVVLSVAAGICPLLDWSVFEAELSGNLVGPASGDRIERRSISLVLVVPSCRIQMFGVPPKRGTVASQTGMVACPTFDLGHMVEVCMRIDMAYVDMGVEVSMQVC